MADFIFHKLKYTLALIKKKICIVPSVKSVSLRCTTCSHLPGGLDHVMSHFPHNYYYVVVASANIPQESRFI